jgi:SPASM domain peptide maturase of grasp-with-spasm system
VLAFIHTGIFESINICLPGSYLTDELLRELEPFSKIKMLIVHSATIPTLQSDYFDVVFTSQTLEDESCCGNISLFYFVPEIKFISESANFNTCLNKKISITKEGIVKNCPSLKKSYGKYYPGRLTEIIYLPEFTEYFHLKKDEIKVCRDCEFRHVCSDCRAYTVDDEILGKPSKCKYDPYTNEWQ